MLFILTVGRTTWLSALIAGIFFLADSLLFWRLSAIKRRARVKVTLLTVQNNDSELMSYIAAYILPFIGFSSGDIRQSLAQVVFFLCVGWIYVRANLTHINPVLSLAGLHISEVTTAGGEQLKLLSYYPRLRPGKELMVVESGDGIALEVRGEG